MPNFNALKDRVNRSKEGFLMNIHQFIIFNGPAAPSIKLLLIIGTTGYKRCFVKSIGVIEIQRNLNGYIVSLG